MEHAFRPHPVLQDKIRSLKSSPKPLYQIALVPSERQARAELILLEQNQANAYDLQQARNEETFYRQQRDVSWFALTGVHLLSILDAHVDANLLAFDVSEDLSMEFAPLIPAGQGPQAAALGIVLSWELNCSKHPKFTR